MILNCAQFDSVANRAQIATSSKRPIEFVEKEEAEVRRRSSVDDRALSLAQQHRRFSLMSEQGRLDSDLEKRQESLDQKETV